ncbi:MAG: hypothetical protein SFY70_13590 [Bacteroidia bacterium]|nr:hypothetical protein [Bacteroidia bacterium]
MKLLKHVPGVLLGLGMVVFGLAKLVPILPEPDTAAFSAGHLAFMSAAAASGYFLQFIGAAEFVGGLLLLSRRFEALGALVLAPISANIVVFHLALAPATTGPGAVVLLLNVVILLLNTSKYRAILAGTK